MDHVVYLDSKADELKKILEEEKRMIIRGATGRKLPYGRVNEGDILYFINNNGEGLVKARGRVTSVTNSDKLTPEQSTQLVNENRKDLMLTEAQFKRWSGKRYLVLIGFDFVEEIDPFEIDKSQFGNMDDWLLIENISNVAVSD